MPMKLDPHNFAPTDASKRVLNAIVND